ncbi:uncharacterized protein LOC111051075 [Nilaparvata lugens]|uniref:uncharacterized protein LOC111051075 n=1 Tax=Nilaparvata lugens TaxID=108931 RepID=UPI00193EBCCE|nr:uncharacterized protein LOC111051075 [Nilaparvata lugens]
MAPAFILFFIFFLSLVTVVFVPGALGVQITALRVPASVRNGSASVLLDCEYSLRPDETQADSGLVVKWFFNATPAPVYQWIRGNRPQELGVLRGRLKLDHKASRHPATMHRALYILNPTTDLSGEYKCVVSTFDDEDFMIKTMTVFVPERRLEVIQRKPSMDSVNVTCLAEGVSPEPRLSLYIERDKGTRVPVPGVKVATTVRSTTFDVAAHALIADDTLETPTVFSCQMKIPNADYVRRKNVVYYPGQMLPSCFSIECCGSIKTVDLFWLVISTLLLMMVSNHITNGT